MATSLSISKASGYPTETSMRINISFSVTYEGSYKTYFELYDYYSDDLIETAWGTTYSMSANSSKSDIYKTFSGLDSGTKYYIVASLWNATTNTRLSISEPTITFTTLSNEKTYYAKVILNGNGGKYGSYTTWTFTGSDTSENSYCNIWVPFSDPGFKRAGYVLDGWYDENVSSFYDVNDEIRIKATSTSSSSPTTVNLYADWVAVASTVDAVNASSDDQDVTIAVNFTAGTADTYKLIFSLRQDGDDIYTHTSSGFSMSAGGTKSVSYTFSDVDYGDYDVYVILVYSSTPSVGLDYGTDTVSVTPPRPSAWYWSEKVAFGGKTYNCPIVSGGEVPYYYNATDDVYQVYFMGATEWNNFLIQVNLLRNYHGLSNYSFSKATAGYPMQASQYNQVAAALNAIQSGSVSTVSAGGTVGASAFKKLQTAFNNLR